MDYDKLYAGAFEIIASIDRLEKSLEDPDVYNNMDVYTKTSQELKALKRKEEVCKAYLESYNEKKEAEEMLIKESDKEVIEYLQEQLKSATDSLPERAEKLMTALIPENPDDSKDCILEIRAGVGGDESCLFAEEIMRMYMRYSEYLGFKTEYISDNPGDDGGVKEAIFRIIGHGAYGIFRFEGGVHRVQRIPKTESQGRIHTSAVSVVVLVEVLQKEIHINPNDLRIDVFRSGGNGGQSVNTTDSAVRITHLPTGIVATCQDGKNQIKNKEKALQVLASRIKAIEDEKRQEELGAKRLSSIGSGDRSDKMRTYNFPQDRITDHRINQNFSNIPAVMNGDLERITQSLLVEEQRMQLKNDNN